MKLLDRAKADIPRIEQLERDHPRMARLFQKGLLPFGVWEQLLEAEQMMDTEVCAHAAALLSRCCSFTLSQRCKLNAQN